MNDIKNLLKRFKESLNRDVVVREEVAAVIREQLGFDVRLADISIKSDTLRIKTSPPKRNAIKLEEARVLLLIRERAKLNIARILY